MSQENNFIPNLESYKPLSPFKLFVKSNFPFIENTFEALDNYGLYCKIVEYLNTVIENENTVESNVQDLYNAFVSLNTYVSDYFDNLDVQDEINNKLDEMAEQGELQEIISQFLNSTALWIFDNVDEMQDATNLMSGSYAKTLGYYEKNDKGSTTYYITDDVMGIDYYITLDSSLYAIPIINDVVNVIQFGAKGDGTTDDLIAFQNAIDSNASIIEIPETDNFYKISDKLDLKSNMTLRGFGNKSFIKTLNATDKAILNLSSVSNVIIDNVHLENESTQTGSSIYLGTKFFIFISYCENIKITNCYFNKCYGRGIEIEFTKNVEYINNKFTNATFNMLHLRPETENIVVDDSIFDTITSSSSQHGYLFSTGRNDTNTYQFGSKNIIVKNSKFLNNPIWEGIDTHMCLGFYCYNNYIENCYCGIMAVVGDTHPIVQDSDLRKVHGDIFIENNIIKKGTNSIWAGITAGSNDFIVNNLNIKNNIIEGYGSPNELQNGAIRIIHAKNINVIDNTITDSNSSSISFNYCYNVNLIGNNCLEQSGNAGINLTSAIWNINIENNIIANYRKTKLGNGIRSPFNTYAHIGNNNIYANNRYNLKGTIYGGTGNISESTTQMGKKGDLTHDQYGIPKYYCTDDVLRPAKTETLSSINISGDAGTNEVVSNNIMINFAIGEEITIPRSRRR